MSSPLAHAQRQSISRGIQFVLLVALLAQIPLASFADQTIQQFLIAFVLLHVIALSLLRVANSIGIRNLLLCVTYASYIVMSGALWQGDYLAHWFLPVGIVFAVFLFRLHYPLLLLCVVIAFNTLFLFIEYQWIQWRADIDLHYLAIKGYLNAVLMSGCCTFIGMFIRWHLSQFWRSIQTQSEQRKKTLDQVLPECFQTPLTQFKQPALQSYKNVTVLFFDMSGYTEFAANCETLTQINMLDTVYRRFDEICAAYGVERIKTNGDQYIAAAGVPLTYTSKQPYNYTPALAICYAAKHMKSDFQTLGNTFGFASQGRIGIASGDVTAGVIGLYKPCYDLWGLPMLLASRLEGTCRAPHINICEATYLQIKSTLPSQFVENRNLRGLGSRGIYTLTLDT